MPVQLVIAAGTAGLIVSGITIWVFVRPGVERGKAVADAILGEAPVKDRSGKEIAPARPGLVSRTTTLEDSVKALIELVADQRAIEARVDVHETRLNDHDTSIAALIASTFERGAHISLTAAEIEATKRKQEKP